MNASVPPAMPYEIHLTVKDIDRDTFVAACKHAKVKPVMLDLHTRMNTIIPDAMTSQRVKGQFFDALRAACATAHVLRVQYGMPVVRYKIETAPFHPAAVAEHRGADQYFECHIPIEVPTDMVNVMWWREVCNLCASLNLHLSRNVFKVSEETGTSIHMATLRDYRATSVDFQRMVEDAVRVIRQSGLGLTIGSTEIEFAIMDTHPAHDSQWISYPNR